MKKLLLLLFMFTGLNIFGQITENFEGATFPPTGWVQFESGTGLPAGPSWSETSVSLFTYLGAGKSATITRENVATGQAIDWLVTNLVTVPANGQLRFYAKTVQTGVQGGTFEIKISSASQTNPTDFTNIVTFSESTLTAVVNVYEEKVIDIPATYPPGSQIYIAFVMSNDNGEQRWCLDNVNVVQKCSIPTGPLLTSLESTTSAQLSWGSPAGVTNFDVQVCPLADTFGGPSTITYSGVTNPFVATGLAANTLYKFQVRSICVTGFPSDWFGPRNFQTASFGDTCAGPIVVGALPYQTIDNTANYLDTNDVAQPLACSGSATNYMAGNDVFYTFTPAVTGNYIFNLAPTNASSSLHVYSQCPVVGMPAASCLGGVANTGTTPRNIVLNGLVAGTTYYVIVSSSAAQQTVGYTLTIQQAFCNQPTGLTATNTSGTSANLSWVADPGIVSWEVSYAPAPYGLPTGAGTTTTIPFSATGLIPGIVYQYYVRANCNDGNFSIWSGPFTFVMPQVPTPLNFIDGFETLTGWTLNNATQTNKWAVGTGVNNGGTHALYVTDTNGATNNYNITGTSVAHAYKDFVIPAGATQLDLTFDWRSSGETATDYFRVWTVPATYNPVAGTQIPAIANHIKVSNDLASIPTFITQNYTLNATPYAGGTMRLAFEWRNNATAGNQPPAAIDNVKLDLITCPKPGSLVISNIVYNAAQLTWVNGASESQWEVLVLPAGSPAPNATAVGVVTSTGSPYMITGLTSVTCYDVYVRAKCGPTEVSLWSVPVNFCTTPNYCAGDHFYDTGGISGNYSNNQNITSIICPDNMGDIVTVVFNDFNLATGDNLVIRDGNLPTSPIVGTYTGTTLPPSFSATSASGCLTFVFTSNATTTSAGWDATIYCTPPITCFKPVTLGTITVGATTATLTWTETGTATQWEILVLPFGSNAPILGQPGVPVNLPPPYVVTGLSPSSSYTFYVRAICSSTSASFWSDGFTFFTTPINDLCANATVASVNDDLNCSLLNHGTLAGSSNSGGLPGTCSSTANDVWYQFVATKPTYIMNMLNETAGATINYSIYTGGCGSLATTLPTAYCNITDQRTINNLIVGQTYYVRVYNSTGATGEFDLCIGAIPCPEAIPLCSTPLTYPNTTNIANLGSFGCLGTSPNASFFFLETTVAGTLSYTISQTSGDVDYALWGPYPSRSNGCGFIPNGSPISCSYSTAAVETFTLPATPGQVYILMVTNFVNTAGTITIGANPTNTAQTACYTYNTFNYSAVTYCNSSANQTPVLVAGAVAGTYTASPAGLSINSTTGEVNFSLSTPGTYTVTSTTIPALPPPALNDPIITTRTVIVTPTPNATIAYGSASYCKSNSTSQPVIVTGNGGAGSYYSSTPAGLEYALDPVSGNIIPVLGNVGIYTVTFTVPAQGGCPQYTTTTQVEILASPIIPAQVDVNACNSYVLPALTVGNYFTATGGTGTPLNAGDVITTNQTIYVYATNGICSSEDPFNVNIVSIPTPTFDYLTQPTCTIQTGSINITAPVAVGGTVPTNLFISEVTDANTGSLTYVELYNGTGAPINLSGYKLRTFNNGSATVTGGCDNVLSGTIANNSTFIIKLSSDANIPGVVPNLSFTGCSAVNDSDNIRLTTSANVLVDIWGLTTNTSFTPSGQPGYTFRRLASATPLPRTTFVPGDWTAIDPENYSDLGQYTLNSSSYEYSVDGGTYQTNTTFTGIAPGTHYFVVHDLINNCYSAPISFTINAVPYTNPVTDFSYTTPICITSSNPSPTLAAGFTSGGTYSYVGTGLGLNSTTGTIDLATSTAGTYVVTYTYPLDLANCINAGSSTATIVILAEPVADDLADVTICDAYQLVALSAGNNYYTAAGGTGTLLNAGDIITTSQTIYIYTQTGTTPNCTDETSFIVTILPKVTPTFDPIADLCIGDGNVTLPITSTNGIDGTWSPAFVDTSVSGTLVYTFAPNTTECANPTTITVQVELCEIQKGISPNGDGSNDFLELVAKKVEIFNRFGKEVYTKTNYNNDWHGQFMGGGDMPDGTYYYVIELVSGEKKTGWIYINRVQ